MFRENLTKIFENLQKQIWKISKIIMDSKTISKHFERYFGKFGELYRKISKIITKHFEKNSEKYFVYFREVHLFRKIHKISLKKMAAYVLEN